MVIKRTFVSDNNFETPSRILFRHIQLQTRMKSTTLLTAFVLLVKVTHSLYSKGISEAICYFSKLKYADISKETELVIHLSKILFKKCDIKIRFLSESTQIGSDFIGFAYNGKNYKEIFQLL